ncbi:DUF6660 family protein [Elizabethkingia anophelis]|uniref:DUF6660 family protein n=1 Tax=Elizabethkingia anophelis TaxID=1117645 RepID=UPI00389205BA
MEWQILLVLILALFIVPCSDASNNCEISGQVKREITHSHNNDRDDVCSPFCQCSCCGVSVVNFRFELPEFIIPTQIFSTKKVVIRDCNFISNYFGNIWQPPKFNV